jgi:hypothetical protein
MSIFDSVTSAVEQPAVGVSDVAAAAPDAQPSTADAALFLALLQAQLPPAASSPAMSDAAAGDTSLRNDPAAVEVPQALPSLPSGNVLPLLTGGDGSPVPVPGGSLPDDKLEDFAVDLGIDRELARLLLSQTVPHARGQLSARSTHSLSPVQIALQASQLENQDVTTSTMLGSWAGLSPTREGEAGLGDTDSRPGRPVSETVLGAWPQPFPLVGAPPISISGSSSIQPQNSALNLPSMSPPPQALTLDVSAILIRALPESAAGAATKQDPDLVAQQTSQSPLADEDILRWRTASVHASVAATAEGSDWNASFSKLRLSPEALATAATAGNHEQGVPDPGLSTTPSFTSTVEAATTALTPSGAQAVPAPLAPRVAESAKAEQPIQVPAGDLTYEDRAAAFSEQVGRRIVESIRTEKWEVNIRLDPEHLAPLDIRLDVD